MAKSDSSSSSDPNPLVSETERNLKTAVGGDASVHERVSAVESLLGEVTAFLAWLFPGHAVPGTPLANDPAAAGPLQGQPIDNSGTVGTGGTLQTPGTLTAGLGTSPA